MESHRLRPTIPALIALCLATLACGVAAPDTNPTLAPNFSTVTPGGRISVSLLTPTLTQQVAPGIEGTLIGPVATATAEAAAGIAAAAPTATQPGVFSQPARCPSPGDPTLPAQTPAFNRYAETIVQFLSAGGPATVLEARLRAWGALTDFGGLVRADRDFTGDGVPEVLVVVLDPRNAEFPFPGDLFVFGCEDGGYRLLYQAGANLQRSAPLVVYADDMNGDALNDLVIVTQDCAEAICDTGVSIVAWSLALGSFSNLVNTAIDAPAADVNVTDQDLDGILEVVLTSGIIDSPGAGPQRVVTTVLCWDGEQYAIASQQPSASEYRIHVLHDGDDALLDGDYGTAVDLYQRAATDDGLLAWQYPSEAAYLAAYARFKIMVAYAFNGDVSAAQNAHDALVSQYSSQPGDNGQPTPVFLLPGGQFAEMTRLFWQDYALNRNPQLACQVVFGYTRANPASYDVLNSFGTANRTYAPADLCPIDLP